MEIPGPMVIDYQPLIDYLLSDSRYGQMWLQYIDQDTHRNNLLHVCIELHNVDFTRLILAKTIEQSIDLLGQRNGNQQTPTELLEKEIQKAENGLNVDKKARQLNLLQIIKNMLTT